MIIKDYDTLKIVQELVKGWIEHTITDPTIQHHSVATEVPFKISKGYCCDLVSMQKLLLQYVDQDFREHDLLEREARIKEQDRQLQREKMSAGTKAKYSSAIVDKNTMEGSVFYKIVDDCTKVVCTVLPTQVNAQYMKELGFTYDTNTGRYTIPMAVYYSLPTSTLEQIKQLETQYIKTVDTMYDDVKTTEVVK